MVAVKQYLHQFLGSPLRSQSVLRQHQCLRDNPQHIPPLQLAELLDGASHTEHGAAPASLVHTVHLAWGTTGDTVTWGWCTVNMKPTLTTLNKTAGKTGVQYLFHTTKTRKHTLEN